MDFIEVAAGDAVGGLAAHSVRQNGLVIRKGETITAAHAEALAANGIQRVTVARLAPGDRHEDEVALALARRAAGAHVRIADPFTGRANLFSEASGVLVIDAAGVDRFNAVDERITIATLPAFRVVTAGEMVGTVKIIPFAVEGAVAEAAAAHAANLLSIAPFRPRKVGVVSTLLPGLKPRTIAKTLQALEARLAKAGSSIAADVRTPHDRAALVDALRKMSASEVDLMIIFGASAVTDRRDVAPAAIEAAGGRLIHVGMPVDPGNLLVLGNIGGKPAIGAPGCARSPRENGFDWVLQRLLADLPIAQADIMRMGVGGLLMEIVTRPQPRDPQPADEA